MPTRRTRSQQAALAQQGIPPSPPQSLPNERRRRRPRAQNGAPAEDSAKAQSVENPSLPSEEPPNTESSADAVESVPSHYTSSETQTSHFPLPGESEPRHFTSSETQTSGLPIGPLPGASEVQVQLGWLEPTLPEGERALTFNVPASVLPGMLSYLSQHPMICNNQLPYLFQTSSFAQKLTNEHDNDRVQILTVLPGAKKRKREHDQTIESILQARTQRDWEERDHHRNRSLTPPSASDRQHLRQSQLEETQRILQESRESTMNGTRTKRTCTKLVPKWYDENGNLRLGQWEAKTYEVDDNSDLVEYLLKGHEQTASTSFAENDHPQHHGPVEANDVQHHPTETTKVASDTVDEAQDPYNDTERPYSSEPLVQEEQIQTQSFTEQETPRNRGWALTSILPSSVSRLIPFSSRRTPSATTTSRLLPAARPQVLNNTKPPSLPTYEPNLQSSVEMQHVRNTPNNNIVIGVHHLSNSPIRDLALHDQVSHPGDRDQYKEQVEHELRAKIEAELKAQAREESKRITAAFESKKKELDEQEKRLQRERIKLAQHLDETIPGSKRKRMPSPDIIPNPTSGGFGMDLDYFYLSDGDSDDEHGTPTRRPQTKRARTSSNENELTGDPHRDVLSEGPSEAQRKSQHTPRKYVTPTKQSQTYNARASLNTSLTRTSPRNVFEQATSPSHQTGSQHAPNGPTMTFRVPSPTSSDDSIEDELELRQGLTNSQSPLASKSTAPTQRANSNYTATPAPPHLVEQARRKALMHQPKTGSRLRNTSRLSTSTAASDVAEDPSLLEKSSTPERAHLTNEEKFANNEQCIVWEQNFLANHGNAYETYIKTISPRVAAAVEAAWTAQDTKAAEKAFEDGVTSYAESQKKIGAETDRQFTEGDRRAAEVAFDQESASWRGQQLTGAVA